MYTTTLRTIVDHLSFDNDADATLDMGIEAVDGWLVDEQLPWYCPYTYAIEMWVQMDPEYVPAPYTDDENNDGDSILDYVYA